MRFLAGLALVAVLVVGAAASSAAATSVAPSVKGGKFEVTCKPNSIQPIAIDPIVNPGAPSMHEHTFFGRAVTNTSTPATLQAGSGTTCLLAQDGAAYWVPTACDGPCVDAAGAPTMGMQGQAAIANRVKPVKVFAYYFGTTGIAEAQFPPDIELVGGDAHATAPLGTTIVAFSCGNGGGHTSPNRSLPYDCTAANGVSGTDGVVAIVKMPYCLGSGATSDRASYSYGGSTGACPAGTTTLGQVQLHVHYGLDATGYQTGSRLNFASGPAYTFHGDWENGWLQTKLAALVSGCLDIDRDCGFLTNTNPGPT